MVRIAFYKNKKSPQTTCLQTLQAGAPRIELGTRGFGAENICSIIFSQPLENADFTGFCEPPCYSLMYDFASFCGFGNQMVTTDSRFFRLSEDTLYYNMKLKTVCAILPIRCNKYVFTHSFYPFYNLFFY